MGFAQQREPSLATNSRSVVTRKPYGKGKPLARRLKILLNVYHDFYHTVGCSCSIWWVKSGQDGRPSSSQHHHRPIIPQIATQNMPCRHLTRPRRHPSGIRKFRTTSTGLHDSKPSRITLEPPTANATATIVKAPCVGSMDIYFISNSDNG